MGRVPAEVNGGVPKLGPHNGLQCRVCYARWPERHNLTLQGSYQSKVSSSLSGQKSNLLWLAGYGLYQVITVFVGGD